MKLPFVCSVAGVSFRQEVVTTMHPGDRIEIIHNAEHPEDSNACAVQTPGGELLGYVPARIAARLVAERDERHWPGTITEVLANDTFGLRIKVGEAPAGPIAEADDGAEADVAAAFDGDPFAVSIEGTGGDGAGSDLGGGIDFEPAIIPEAPSSDAHPGEEPADAPPSDPVLAASSPRADTQDRARVFSKSGRALGVFEGEVGGKIQVRKSDGSLVEFPPSLVRVASPAGA